MFEHAYSLARSFTRPVVISRRHQDGHCTSGIGTFVVVNRQGWIVTAYHLAREAESLAQQAQAFNDASARRAAIAVEPGLDKKERKRRQRQLPAFGADAVTHTSAWWALDGVRPVEMFAVPAADLAFARLEPFDPVWVPHYPVFKDPARPMSPGRSLCRLGFPFHSIDPTFDTAKNAFILPTGSLPLPLFPLDGIFTREVDIAIEPPLKPPPPFKLRLLETSSAGLRGQSGGPIFDVKGSVWGIQSSTTHLPLGFSPPVPGGRAGEKEHQFLNVGWGVHAATIVGAMQDRGISFDRSDY